MRLALAYAGLGMWEDALLEGLESSRLLPTSVDLMDGVFVSESLARIHMMVGDTDAALERLELLLSSSTWVSVELLRLDPLWDPLRDQPRFQQLAR